ncbi:hypothetical protein EC912_10720 [Luteibacter rhizovicinus]|uniref:Uncharacterized protein n=1 Tax=Luteibacter rhizovicinus TaxID=242606 RepID=A0A4R3YMK1_9GAMM|nr:hypothetical protein [Luteibacter rhizovicinus]TCV92314.1 hypothetical protein EC912_10720 [Luteibacter rhizovicinus]
MSSKQNEPSASYVLKSGHDLSIPCPLCKGSRALKLGDIDEAITERLSGMRGVTDLLIDVPMIDAEQGSVAQAAYVLRGLIDEVVEMYRVMSPGGDEKRRGMPVQ